MACPIFLRGKEPPYMESEEPDLNDEKIMHAVNCMTRNALESCAAGYLLFMKAAKISPKKICETINASLRKLDESRKRRKECEA